MGNYAVIFAYSRGGNMYLLNKIVHIDKKAMNRAVDLVAEKSGKNKLAIFLDMVYCGLRYQAGYNDYVEFEFCKMRVVSERHI